MQMHNPSHFCIITISVFLALGAQSEIANVPPNLPNLTELAAEAVRFAKTAPTCQFMHNLGKKIMQSLGTIIMQSLGRIKIQ